MSNKPIWLLKLSLELLKYWAVKTIGNEALASLTEGMTEIVGENAIEIISNFLDQGNRVEHIIQAFKSADECFHNTIDDEKLKQAIISKPLCNLPRLENVAKKLPSTLDDQGLLDLIKAQLREDWGGQISEAQIEKAAKVYRNCFDKSLAAQSEQLLPTIFRKIDRVENMAEKIYESQQKLGEKLDKIGPSSISLDRLFGNSQIVVKIFQRGSLITSPDSTPLFPKPHLQRKKVLYEMMETLKNHPWLALVDGPGKGKTQLANAISKQESKEVKWISFRYQTEPPEKHFRDQIASWLMDLREDVDLWETYLNGLLSLQTIAYEIGTHLSGNGILIIDDLPDPLENHGLYADLETVTRILISQNLQIVSTGQRELPPSIKNNLPVELYSMPVPPFTAEDVLDILVLSGAPPEYKKEGVSLWITAITKGHPGLIAGTIGWLKQQSWDYSLPTIDGLITAEPVKEIQEYSRRHLVNSLVNPQKELIYRLSVIGENFSRKLAFDIANIIPAIQYPGETLDFLTGPWLDRLSNGNYGVSPLIGDAGRENLSFEIQQAIHRKVIQHLMPDNVVNAAQAHSILLHMWQAKDYIQFAEVLLLILTSIKTEAQANYLDWATSILIDVPWPDELDIDWKIIIHAAQLHVRSITHKNISILNEKLESLLEQADPDENLFAMIYSLATTGVMSQELPVEITMPRSFKLLALMYSSLDKVSNWFDENLVEHLPNLVWSQVMRIQGSEQVVLFFNEVLKLSFDQRVYLLNGTEALEASMHLMDQLWFTEASKPQESRDWQKVFSVIDLIEELPIFQEFLSLKVASTRSRAVILADFLKDRDKALEILDRIVVTDISDPNTVFILNYSLGCFSSDAEYIDRSIGYFEKAAVSPGDNFSHCRIDNLRRLAIEKSRKKDWKSAKELCIRTYHKFAQSEEKTIYILDMYELFGELAFIQWNNQDYLKACASMYGYVMGLVDFEASKNDNRYKEAYNKAGHGLGWFTSVVETGTPPATTLDGGQYTPLFAGLFGIRREILGNITPPLGYSKAILLTQLAQFAFGVGLFRTAWKTNILALEYFRLEKLEKDLRLAVVYSDLSIQELILGNTTSAFNYALSALQYLAVGFKNREYLINKGFEIDLSQVTGKDISDTERQSLYFFLTPAFLLLVSSYIPNAVIINKLSELEQLCQESEQISNHPEWLKILAHFKEIAINLGNGEKSTSIIEGFGDRTIFQIVDYIINSVTAKLSLRDAFTKQVSACISLVGYGSFGKRILLGTGRLLHTHWLKVANNQRFALHNPDIFYQELKSISPNMGGKTAVKVLKCVSTALKIGIPKDAIDKLELLT